MGFQNGSRLGRRKQNNRDHAGRVRPEGVPGCSLDHFRFVLSLSWGCFYHVLLLFQVSFILYFYLQISSPREGSPPFWLAIAVGFV